MRWSRKLLVRFEGVISRTDRSLTPKCSTATFRPRPFEFFFNHPIPFLARRRWETFFSIRLISWMEDDPIRLKVTAEKRRLVGEAHDPMTVAELTALAEECEAKISERADGPST